MGHISNRRLYEEIQFGESQIVSILKKPEGGIPTVDILRAHGISQSTLYKWLSKYSGLVVSELRCMKDFEQMLSEYKTMVFELSRDNRGLKSLIEKSSNANG